jgi:hypothetical protein
MQTHPSEPRPSGSVSFATHPSRDRQGALALQSYDGTQPGVVVFGHVNLQVFSKDPLIPKEFPFGTRRAIGAAWLDEALP